MEIRCRPLPKQSVRPAAVCARARRLAGWPRIALPLGEEAETDEAGGRSCPRSRGAGAEGQLLSPAIFGCCSSPGFWGCSPDTALAAESGRSRHVLRRLEAQVTLVPGGDVRQPRRSLVRSLAPRNQLHLPGLK